MEDQQIVELFWNRSEEAISQTQVKYADYCGSIAYQILQSREDSEECVSDTWLRTWDAIPPKKPTSLKAFVGRITRNLSLDRWRARSAEKRGGGEVPLVLEELADCVSQGGDPLSELEARRMIQCINGFLRALPEEKCNLFLLRYWYLEPVSQIAARTGLGEKKVKNDLYQIRKKLKQHLEKEEFAI